MKTIINIENTDGVVEATGILTHERVWTIPLKTSHPGDGFEYTLAWVRTGVVLPTVTATVDYTAYDGASDYPHGLIEFEFEFKHAGETVKIVETIAVNPRTNKPWEGTAWLALDNTEEYEPDTLRRLTEIYGHESEVLEAMRDALVAVEEECEHCGLQHCPFDLDDLHNCSENWVPAEWEREADGMNTSVSILMAIVDVTGVAFGCTNTGGRSAADKEWHDIGFGRGDRYEEIIKRAWKLEDPDEDTLCWGQEIETREVQ